jgi:hypothetical protein
VHCTVREFHQRRFDGLSGGEPKIFVRRIFFFERLLPIAFGRTDQMPA